MYTFMNNLEWEDIEQVPDFGNLTGSGQHNLLSNTEIWKEARLHKTQERQGYSTFFTQKEERKQTH